MNRIQDGPTLCFDEADESTGSAPHSVGDPIESHRPVYDSELSLAHDVTDWDSTQRVDDAGKRSASVRSGTS